MALVLFSAEVIITLSLKITKGVDLRPSGSNKSIHNILRAREYFVFNFTEYCMRDFTSFTFKIILGQD